MRKYQIISADGHMEVPIDWVEYCAGEVQRTRPEAAATRRRQ